MCSNPPPESFHSSLHFDSPSCQFRKEAEQLRRVLAAPQGLEAEPFTPTKNAALVLGAWIVLRAHEEHMLPPEGSYWALGSRSASRRREECGENSPRLYRGVLGEKRVQQEVGFSNFFSAWLSAAERELSATSEATPGADAGRPGSTGNSARDVD